MGTNFGQLQEKLTQKAVLPGILKTSEVSFLISGFGVDRFDNLGTFVP